MVRWYPPYGIDDKLQSLYDELHDIDGKLHGLDDTLHMV